MMGGKGSGIHQKKFNVPGIGQLKLLTIAKLIEKGFITVKYSLSTDKYDAVIVDDQGSKIIIKGIKKITEIE